MFSWGVSLSQETEEAEAPAREAAPNSGFMPTFAEVEAADGTTLYITMVEGVWGACRRVHKYVEQAALRQDVKRWTAKMEIEEVKGSCVQTQDLDLVLVGPSDVPGTLAVSFRDRADVHATIAWFISCDAIPRVAEKFCERE